ncbi:recombinase family protein [Dorea formicigenerans]|uniref:recombinase family protein n=1 Tax=Dorea formicigenerans TaxID=39486 RepID=UPI0022E7F589|nr:recombinase family protein [Dorea formicigenerans]
MKESEERSSNIDEQKARIRQRYKGIDPEELEVIPALPPEDIFKTEKKLRVAVYARVSTDDPRQTSSYELQKNHYQDVVNKNPNWMLVEIYADEGISGTSLQHRDAFKKMIEDCETGKIDLIITKSVSRFARNVVDCIRYVRELSSLRPPVGVFFETEHLNTLDPKSEMILSFMSTLAQEESHTKSEIMNSSIEMRFRRGIFLTPPLLGYDQDENGDLVINPHEAKIVQLIFYMYLNGSSTQQIADSLTELGCKTKKNNDVWSPSTILQILQNERHCGDVLARKTWTPNYLDHKSRKNNQDRNQYRKVGHHEAIISRDDFIAVQKLITNAKYGNKEILPELHVIQKGSLSGFISINPRWSGFKARDYFEASQSVLKPANMNVPDTITASAGSFDLRDYEVARGQFFSSVGRISVSFSYKQISFNKDAIRKFPNIKFVELLIHPSSKLLAIRPCSSETKNKVQWSRLKDGQLIPKPISGAAFLPTLYEIFKWDKKCKYRILGVAHQKDNENVLIFNMDDTEIRIPTNTNDVSAPNNNTPDTISDSKSVLAYPADWMNSFGNNYYTQSQAPELTEFTADKNWQTASESKPYKEPELKTTPKETIIQNIKNIITEIKGDTQ